MKNAAGERSEPAASEGRAGCSKRSLGGGRAAFGGTHPLRVRNCNREEDDTRAQKDDVHSAALKNRNQSRDERNNAGEGSKSHSYFRSSHSFLQ